MSYTEQGKIHYSSCFHIMHLHRPIIMHIIYILSDPDFFI